MRTRVLFLDRFDGIERHLESQIHFGLERSSVVLGQRSRFKKLALIELRDGEVLVDLRVKIGLSECRFVAFVVAVTAIAIHVDHDVASEFLAKIERELADLHAGERVVAVDVKNRDLDHLRDIGRVHRRARIFGERGESYLIVHHHMHGSAGPVTMQLRHVQCFGNDPLPRECRVAMQQERQNFAAMFGVVANPLTRPRFSFHHWIDCFEVTRIWREQNFDLRAGSECSHRAITKMVFHIAIASDEVRNVVFVELGENVAKRFLQKIREHVEPAAVRHAHANFLHT